MSGGNRYLCEGGAFPPELASAVGSTGAISNPIGQSSDFFSQNHLLSGIKQSGYFHLNTHQGGSVSISAVDHFLKIT
jgi:hypothetical protein